MHLEEAAGIANSMIDGKDISKLTPQGQSSERYLRGTIVSWRDIFDKW